MAALGERSGQPPGPTPGRAPGVIDLYRSLHAAGLELAERSRAGVLVPALLVAAWFVLRTADAWDRPAAIAWAAAAVLVALVSPSAGLVLAAAIAPFPEPPVVGRLLGVTHLVIGATGLAVLVRVLARPRSMPWSPPLLLGLGVGAGTAAGVVLTFRTFDRAYAQAALDNWLAGVGAGIVVLAAVAWIARGGDRRPLVAAVASATLAGWLTLLDHASPALGGSLLGWLIAPKDFGFRISGVIPSPNALASMLVGPTALLVAAAVLGPRAARRWRAAAAVAVLPLVACLLLTFSRAALLALFVLAVVLAWRVRRALAVGLLAAGLVLGVLLLPEYIETRARYVPEGRVAPGQVLVASDVHRLRAWGAATAMFLDRPLTGHGFRSYRRVGDVYGDPILNSPHNEWLRFFAEEGAVVGVLGLAWGLLTFAWLLRRPGWLGAGLAAAFAGWAITATFNNPLLFVQVSSIAFTLAGTGLGLPAPPGVVAADAATPEDAPVSS
ncbi:MAG TPA: O-antigen ligase family protein [Candidatus Limnocylindrales bacterium]|nr:O-antigen ligase family protein [Candidatus Limnocylindrales bacterium]